MYTVCPKYDLSKNMYNFLENGMKNKIVQNVTSQQLDLGDLAPTLSYWQQQEKENTTLAMMNFSRHGYHVHARIVTS